MGPARRSVPAALRFLGGLSVPLLLLLLLCPPAAQGDCSLPPEVPNAHPTLSDRDLKSFPEGTAVTYKCNEGFVKVPGKPDSVICLGNNQWSEVAAFCNRSCDVPPRLRFASLKRSFSKQNYFPEGFVVEYDCRPGYRRNQTLSDKLTCLQNFTWSTPDEFCKKKSCPTPGDITHGHVSITTDISYGASISFSCDTGYRLVGSASSYCSLADQAVEWSDPLPKCEGIPFCRCEKSLMPVNGPLGPHTQAVRPVTFFSHSTELWAADVHIDSIDHSQQSGPCDCFHSIYTKIGTIQR